MLILPDRHAPVGRLLLPQRKSEWRAPSLAQRKDQLGNQNSTRFRLTGRLDDGHVAWRGWFDDREDADAFLFAVLTGSILVERELWRLPTPNWHPDFGERLSYDFATVTFLSSGAGGNQTWTVPSDWNSAANFVEALGAGGAGAAYQVNITFGHGGAGGAYTKLPNLSLTVAASITYRIGAGVTGSATITPAASGDTWFNDTAYPTTGTDKVGAKAGAASGGAAGNAAGGAAASGYPSSGATRNSGGAAGTAGTGSDAGGGAAGASGNGTKGGNAAGVGVAANGGSGDAGSGGVGGTGLGNNGAGSTTPGGAGGNGTEWDASHGSGGGGGTGSTSTDTTGGGKGGAGGNYGGSGGGGGGRGGGGTPFAGSGGDGIQGLLVITYTPAILYSQLERGIRGVNRGIVIGSYH